MQIGLPEKFEELFSFRRSRLGGALDPCVDKRMYVTGPQVGWRSTLVCQEKFSSSSPHQQTLTSRRVGRIGQEQYSHQRTQGRVCICWTLSRHHSMNDEQEATDVVGAALHLPALVVFDLDYTLWPYFCDSRSENEIPLLYPQAKSIIHALRDKGVPMAIASRSPTADVARTFLNKLDLLPSFCAMEIYPSWNHKTDHFKRIRKQTGVPYTSMLFFDDEERNIQAISQMGVKSVLVQNGVDLNALKEGLQKFGGAESGAHGQVRRQRSLLDFWHRRFKGKGGTTTAERHG